ncbi:MAG: cytochrome c-type biogenesis protein CcmH [Rhizobiaceae bacterium]|nr:cytochrome c-type biogenesis protein CcmH [Rhizobiaceae bacterium]
MIRRTFALLLLALALAQPVFAVQPDEVLKDPALEARARAISSGLRCMVCQNQSIDDSNADLARDLRMLVRERLVAGDSDPQVIDFVVARYGEFVLLQPKFSWHNALLWLGPAALLLFGIGYVFLRARSRPARPEEGLTAGEEAALQEILHREKS